MVKPAGWNYQIDNNLEYERELWKQEYEKRYSGGFNIDDDNIPDGVKIPPLAPLAIDFVTRKAKICKNVKVVEAAAASATSLKVAKGSFVYIGMILGTGASSNAGAGTVSAINKSNADYDLLTVSATTATLAVGDVLIEASAAGGTTAKNVCNALNFAWELKVAGATCDALYVATEIQEAKLYVPISQKDKDNLVKCGLFVFV